MVDALPCLVCGAQLQRVIDNSEVQPSDGVMLSTYGNYGSTVFDPMNGNCLYFNLCDDCLVKAGDQGRVKATVNHIEITTDTPFRGNDGKLVVVTSIVGSRRCEAPFVQWHKEIPTDDRQQYLSLEEILDGGFLEHSDYRFNLDRTHFEEMRTELESAVDDE